MFSWIVEKKSKIISINKWTFEVENTFEDLILWQSIAHDWACMTLIEITDKSYKFFAMEETLNRTSFYTKKVWDFFNIERCIRYGDRIDWHFVTWHIDTTWKVEKIEYKVDNSRIIYINFPDTYKNLLIEKWSIAVNWVSLTLVKVWDDYFSISLIPYTLEHTNLWELIVWDIVNLEFDMLGKYVMNTKKLM